MSSFNGIGHHDDMKDWAKPTGGRRVLRGPGFLANSHGHAIKEV